MKPLARGGGVAAVLGAALLALASCSSGGADGDEEGGHGPRAAEANQGGEAEKHPGDRGAGREGHGGGRDGAGAGESAHDGHDDHARTVELTPEAIERSGVRATTPETGSLADHVQATATVEHDIGRVAHIAPLVQGQIAEVKASLGDEVEAGDVVAVLHSVELGQARSAVAEAKASLEVARSNFERQERLEKKGIASERALIEARGAFKRAKARHDAARAKLRTLGASGGRGPRYPLRSKIDGTIIEQHASVGETKGPEDELFVVADTSRVWVIGNVPESSAHAIRPGMDAIVTLSAYPERSWSGRVSWIASTVDPKTRLLPVRVELDNPRGLLRPGLFGTLHLQPPAITSRYPLVPVDAVQRVGGEPVVFVPAGDEGTFRAASVELGAEKGGLVEIRGGLDGSARVVTDGAFDLKAVLTARGRSAAHHH